MTSDAPSLAGARRPTLWRSFPVDPESRRRGEELLAGLRAGQWRPAAWGRFLGRSAALSWQAAAARPRAAAEVTALHAAVLMLARRSGSTGNQVWAAASWLLAITHLGLLGPRGSLGPANAVTLARANLPALAGGRWTGVAALAADVADGRLARGRGEETMFGGYADSVADAAFWTWFAARHEPSRGVRAAAFAAWTAPALAGLALSLARGAVTVPPRHALVRPSASVAALLVFRALARGITSGSCAGPSSARRSGASSRAR